MIKPVKIILIVALAAALGVQCTDDLLKPGSDEVKVKFSLTDAPADYKAVLVDIQGIRIIQPTIDTGWVDVENIQTGIYDLLQLQNGIDTLLGETVLDTGRLSQIRLILGENNTLITTDDTVKLSTPSAQQSGLKIMVNETLEAGNIYSILLDFDADKSVIKAGNSGKYNLKPNIKANITATPDSIQ